MRDTVDTSTIHEPFAPTMTTTPVTASAADVAATRAVVLLTHSG